MSMRLALSQLNPRMRAQAEARLAELPKATPRVVRFGAVAQAPANEPPAPKARPRARPARQVRPRAKARKSVTTPTGRLLWQLHAHGYPEPVREHRFHETRNWRFDLAWPDILVAVEIEGLTHEGGRHQRIAGYTSDLQKYNAAALAGWLLVRVTPAMVKGGSAIAVVRRALDIRRRAP